MDVSCGFPPGPDVVDHAVLAESLGYRRAWLYDSPVLYGDVWVALARVAERTERIGLGPAVLIPNLRHVLAQASAIATLEGLAPGADGGGDRHRLHRARALGQKALPWRFVEDYVRTLRALLRGRDRGGRRGDGADDPGDGLPTDRAGRGPDPRRRQRAQGAQGRA